MPLTGSSTSTGDELSGAWNFRDVAEETGIRPGRFFRSSELSRLDDAGRTAMARFGIGDVTDLRSLAEVERRGAGRVPDGVAVHQLPFREFAHRAPHEQGFRQLMERAADEDVAASAGQFMRREYEQYPGLGGAQRAIKQVMSLLAVGRPVITHCLAGKDRTGFTVALVLQAVGVAPDAIMTDFLRSNDAIPSLRQSFLRSFEAGTPEAPTDDFDAVAAARLTEDVLGVRESYLDAARTAIDTRYGSSAGYLTAIGVTPAQIGQLRAALL